VFENQYQRLDQASFDEMHRDLNERTFQNRTNIEGASNLGQLTCQRKFTADLAVEMTRSVRAMLKTWQEG